MNRWILVSVGMNVSCNVVSIDTSVTAFNLYQIHTPVGGFHGFIRVDVADKLRSLVSVSKLQKGRIL